MRFQTLVLKILIHTCILIYSGFRLLLSGPAPCRFYPTCGPYAASQLQEKPFFQAIQNICKRVWHCSPWGSQKDLIAD